MKQSTAGRPSSGRAWPAALITAPLVAVAARALMTPQYQDSADRLDITRYLGELAQAGTRNDTGALLALLSAILYVGTALALARIVGTRLGAIGAALTIVGTFGLCAVSIFVLVAGRLADVNDRQTAIAVLERINNASVFGWVFLALLAGAAGSILLAIGLWRSQQVPRAAAIVTGVGGAGLMVTAPGPLVSFVVGAAVLALIGHTWTAISWSYRQTAPATMTQ